MKHIFNTLTILALICSISSFSCPEGKTAKNNDIAISQNGCGPSVTNLMTQVSSKLGNYFGDNFEGCCNDHDKCFGTCGSDRKACDNTFYSCMKTKCKKKNVFSRSYCKVMAKTFYELVENFGGEFFKKSQTKHCECV